MANFKISNVPMSHRVMDPSQIRVERFNARVAENERRYQEYLQSPEYAKMLDRAEHDRLARIEQQRKEAEWAGKVLEFRANPPAVGTVALDVPILLATHNGKPSFQARLSSTDCVYPHMPVWKWGGKHGLRCFLNKRSTDEAVGRYIRDDNGWWTEIIMPKVRIMAYGDKHAILDVVEWK